MPSRRRPTPISSAAALPASRLPLGTPHLPTPTSQGSATSSSHSPPRFRLPIADPALGKENWDSNVTAAITHSNDSFTMASKITADSAPARSRAEAKLERQNKRNEELEAALTNIIPADKRSHLGKKQWQQLDLSDSTRNTTPSEGGVPVSEVRVNTFRAPSRGSSLSRPVSVLSHRTSETGPSDMDRQDSALTEHGFQVFQRRRNRRHLGDIQAHEDSKAEDRQTTVEAAVDAREIYDVFGNALPGPEVIDANEGYLNGEVRFTQHPTGDVLAHQWSSARYLWENIGQFSNHRKRIEGQLAADRLRGETAEQSLQRNTLAYFRLIAKQREATVTGRPLALKDIQAALPEAHVELSAAPTGLREVAPESARAKQQPSASLQPQAVLPQSRVTPGVEVAGSHREPSTQNIPTGPRSERVRLAPSYTPYQAKQEDPFLTLNSYQQIYGAYNPYPSTYYRQQAAQAAQAQHIPHVTAAQQQHAGLRPDFYSPQATARGQASYVSGIASPYHEVELFTRQGIEQRQQHMHGTQAASAATQNRPQYHTTGTIVSSNSSDTTARPIPQQPYAEASRPKPVTPLEDRSAIRDNLWKQADAAKERNLGQGSILTRTVLCDPLHNQSPSVEAGAESDPVKPDTSPTLSRGVSRKSLQAPTTVDASSFRLSSVPALSPRPPSITKPTSPVSTGLQNLGDSSPAPYPAKQSYTYQPPIINTPPQGTPQNFRGPFFNADTGAHTARTDQKTNDEELHDWWTSGQKFARQEEFFRSVMAAAGRKSSADPMANLPPHLTPIGQRSRTKPQEPNFDPTMTRLLIPVLENLASYVQGPVEKRRDYFSQWTQPPEWCIDRSETGNQSFFDKDWGTPPARVGRDPRYARGPWVDDRTPLRSRYRSGDGSASLAGSFGSGGGYVDRRFGFGNTGYFG